MTLFRNGPVSPGVAFMSPQASQDLVVVAPFRSATNGPTSTGGARGLGNAVARSFAKDGARGIALVDIQDEKTFSEGKAAVEKYGAKVITIHCNVTKEDEVEKAIEQAVKEFGRIDYAANFAGIVGPLAMTWDLDLDKWRTVIEVNQIGSWICMKHELRQMMKQESSEGIEENRVAQRGSIVNCASVNSIQAGVGTTGYTASKHAVSGFTKAAALEARKHNIRVNCVSPGFLLTKLLEPAMGAEALNDAVWKQYEDRQGRAADFEEVGDVVVLLSNPRMSLVNGHNLVIDGGFTINENNF